MNTQAISSVATAVGPSDVVRRVADDAVEIAAVLAGRCMTSQTRPLSTLAEHPIRVAVASELVQQQMLERARDTSEVLREFADGQWWGIFDSAADQLEQWVDHGVLDLALATASACGGLPPRRVERGILGVTRHLRRLPEILAAQAPDGRLTAFRDAVSGTSWSWRPAGRMCAIRVPGNFPTMAVEWLQVLGARRPVVVITSDDDPVVSCLIAAALYGAGLPSDALSVCHGPAVTVWRGADQLVWPGEDVPSGVPVNRVKTYHFGRSKAILLPAGAEPETWQRLTRLAFEGSGRLCTNLSSLAVIGDQHDAAAAARKLAFAFSAIPPLDLDDPAARVPAWPQIDGAKAVEASIKREIAAGAVDVTQEVVNVPLLLERNGQTFLRPTVLLTEPESPLFGTELPFPFVAVASVARDEVLAAVRNSLIVSILDANGSDTELLETLAAEPTISKVFAGDHFDRGYEPIDPHEGYLSDFLFQKKPVLTGVVEPSAQYTS
jgi:thienamycin biosynthesis protein ThnO